MNNKIKGAILATCFAFILSLSMTLTKTLSPDIPTSLVVFMRSFCGLVFFIPFILKNNINKIFYTKKLHLHILRAFFTVSSMFCTYYTYRNLPISFATSIGMSGALFTTKLSRVILKDNVSLKKWGLIILGYIGVIIVINPNTYLINIAVIISLLANILASSSIITAKILSLSDDVLTIMLYSNIGILIFSGLLHDYNSWHLLGMQDILLLFIIGACGVTSQYCLITALKIASPSFLAPFEYFRLVFGIIIGFFIFYEIPHLHVLIGSIIIVLSTYFITLLEKDR